MRKVLLGILLVLGFSACNGAEEQAQSVADDWIQHPSAGAPVPAPTPAPTPLPPPVSVSDLYTGPAEVAAYVQKFVDDARIQGRDVTPDMKNPKLEIQLASLTSYGSSVIGLCETGGGRRRVTFSPTFWSSVNDTQRELLAHHELGHCVLYRPHRNDVLASGAYASIMYPIIMANSTYKNAYDYYQEELFAQTVLASGAADAAVSTTYICNQDELMH